MTKAHEVIAAYWAAAEARDWDAFAALLADDVVYRGPQTREQVRGREAYIRFNVEGFSYDWHIAVQQIVGEDLHAQHPASQPPPPPGCWRRHRSAMQSNFRAAQVRPVTERSGRVTRAVGCQKSAQPVTAAMTRASRGAS